MVADIVTMIVKEWKEIFMQRSSARTGIFNLVIILGLLGVFMPLQVGRDWLRDAAAPLVWSWMPIFLALSIVTDAFAGERERHTLETLLASRLSDRAILFGKIGAAVLYAWGIAVVGLLIGAVTVNVVHAGEGFEFYAPSFFIASVVLSFLAALLISSIGVMVSLRAATARQAYQQMAMVMLGLFLIPMLLPRVVPQETLAALLSGFASINWMQVIVGVAAGLVVLDAIVLLLAMARFRRSRLMEAID